MGETAGMRSRSITYPGGFTMDGIMLLLALVAFYFVALHKVKL
jgi:hypothetical protein